MAAVDDEKSIQDGAPTEIFLFTGSYNQYLLTSHARDITNADGVYSSAYALDRDPISGGSQEDEEIAMNVKMSASHPMVTEYVINQPPPQLDLTLWRVHPADYDSKLLLWQGPVIGWSIRGDQAQCKVPSLFSFAFDGPLPAPKYQAPCNHVLGDDICQVDMTASANTHDTTVSSITENVIVVADNPFPDDECNAGQMIFTSGGERRMIVDNVGTSFTVASPFSTGLSVSDTVTLRRGCNHAFNGDCKNRFNNGTNFGGFPLVPDRNPYTSKL